MNGGPSFPLFSSTHHPVGGPSFAGFAKVGFYTVRRTTSDSASYFDSASTGRT